MSIVYSAPNPICNCTLTYAQRVVRLLAAQGFPGGTLFINPVPTWAQPAGSMIPVSEFASLGITSNIPVYFQLQVPGKPDYYDAAVVGLDLDSGVPADQALQ